MFSLEEAEMLLPVVGSLLERSRAEAVRAAELELEMQMLSQRIFLSGGLHVDVGAAAKRRAEREKAMAQAESLMEELTEIGVNVEDMEEGSLEFPCSVEGRVVLLCWTVGESRIERWREEGEGAVMQRVEDGPFGGGRERLQ